MKKIISLFCLFTFLLISQPAQALVTVKSGTIIPITLTKMETSKTVVAGGNILYTSDGRWKKITGCDYPLTIHDRYETQEQYDILSR